MIEPSLLFQQEFLKTISNSMPRAQSHEDAQAILGELLSYSKEFVPFDKIQQGDKNTSDKILPLFSNTYLRLSTLYGSCDQLEREVVSNFSILETMSNSITQKIRDSYSDVQSIQMSNKLFIEPYYVLNESFLNFKNLEENSVFYKKNKAAITIEEGICTLGYSSSSVSRVPVADVKLVSSQGRFGRDGTSQNNNVLSIIDGNPDTWVEYEVLANSTANEASVSLLFYFKSQEIVNRVRISLNNLGAKTFPQIEGIYIQNGDGSFLSVIDDFHEDNSVKSQKNYLSGDYCFTFLPRKTQVVRIDIKQKEPHASNVGIKYSIGVKEVYFERVKFQAESEVISKELDVDGPISKIGLLSNQYPLDPSEFAEINHYISIDNGGSWLAISPLDLQNEDGLKKAISIVSQNEVKKFRYKASLVRKKEGFQKGIDLNSVPVRKAKQFQLDISGNPQVSFNLNDQNAKDVRLSFPLYDLSSSGIYIGNVVNTPDGFKIDKTIFSLLDPSVYQSLINNGITFIIGQDTYYRVASFTPASAGESSNWTEYVIDDQGNFQFGTSAEWIADPEDPENSNWIELKTKTGGKAPQNNAPVYMNLFKGFTENKISLDSSELSVTTILDLPLDKNDFRINIIPLDLFSDRLNSERNLNNAFILQKVKINKGATSLSLDHLRDTLKEYSSSNKVYNYKYYLVGGVNSSYKYRQRRFIDGFSEFQTSSNYISDQELNSIDEDILIRPAYNPKAIDLSLDSIYKDQYKIQPDNDEIIYFSWECPIVNTNFIGESTAPTLSPTPSSIRFSQEVPNEDDLYIIVVGVPYITLNNDLIDIDTSYRGKGTRIIVKDQNAYKSNTSLSYERVNSRTLQAVNPEYTSFCYENPIKPLSRDILPYLKTQVPFIDGQQEFKGLEGSGYFSMRNDKIYVNKDLPDSLDGEYLVDVICAGFFITSKYIAYNPPSKNQSNTPTFTIENSQIQITPSVLSDISKIYSKVRSGSPKVIINYETLDLGKGFNSDLEPYFTPLIKECQYIVLTNSLKKDWRSEEING